MLIWLEGVTKVKAISTNARMGIPMSLETVEEQHRQQYALSVEFKLAGLGIA